MLQGNVFVNQYLVIKQLGRGAHGSVKLVFDTELQLVHAMKVRAGWSKDHKVHLQACSGRPESRFQQLTCSMPAHSSRVVVHRTSGDLSTAGAAQNSRCVSVCSCVLEQKASSQQLLLSCMYRTLLSRNMLQCAHVPLLCVAGDSSQSSTRIQPPQEQPEPRQLCPAWGTSRKRPCIWGSCRKQRAHAGPQPLCGCGAPALSRSHFRWPNRLLQKQQRQPLPWLRQPSQKRPFPCVICSRTRGHRAPAYTLLCARCSSSGTRGWAGVGSVRCSCCVSTASAACTGSAASGSHISGSRW